MNKFKKYNNIVGWVVFTIATIVYLMTMERTTSFWDCGEFIATAYKLQVGHSPGAPLFMILGRIFTFFAVSKEHVALMMNAMSALMSSFAILFLFWTITHLAKKLIVADNNNISQANIISILGAGVVGALAYTFSDTFWFSAVEAEVYASSSFFTAIVFWAVLKWEDAADQPGSDRWLILTAYLMGLSIGVHLLNLLTIPAIAMVYYFRKYKGTTGGAIAALLIGVAILAFVQFGVIQGVPILASKMEIWFVNSLGLPFDSGAIFFMILLLVVFIAAIYYFHKKGKYNLYLYTIATLFVLIGYSSYISTIVRSRADVPIDMTNPDDIMSLVKYLQRDQYGAQPIFTGPDFNSKPSVYEKGKPVYYETTKDGKPYYEIVGYGQPNRVYDNAEKRFFPRIWSAGHSRFYQSYLGLAENEKASAKDNFYFFTSYQLNHMWWRYFMWNYVGRQNDEQGTSYGEPQNGNWISGIKPIDKLFGRGDIDTLPDYLKNNKARNQYYFLPFILGILGLVYQFNRNKKDGTIVGLLFFFTGIAIVLYLNNTPPQPRERDYAYAGSTYAFAIWIGLGVLMIIDWLNKLLKNKNTSSTVATMLCLLAVPALMAFEGWDDHDRSQKTLARDTAYNVLMSCDPNAIIFTVGDNDTYPLWYLQEVEEVRRDVRIVNLSLLGIDWYIEQLQNKINDADPVPMIWEFKDFKADKNNAVLVRPMQGVSSANYYDLIEMLQVIYSEHPQLQAELSTGEKIMTIPTANFSLDVNKEAVIKSGWVKPEDSSIIENKIYFSIQDRAIYKNALGILNIIAGVARDGWKRPIYFSAGFPGGNDFQSLEEYLQLEGVTHKLMPIAFTNSSPQIGAFQHTNLDKSLDLFLNQYKWGGAETGKVYFDEKNKVMMMTYRITAAKLANALTAADRKSDAVQVLDKALQSIPYSSYQYDQSIWMMIEAYYLCDQKEKAAEIGNVIVRDNVKLLSHHLAIGNDSARKKALDVDVRTAMGAINFLIDVSKEAGDVKNSEEWEKAFTELGEKLQASGYNVR